jgi:hypothetical protein
LAFCSWLYRKQLKLYKDHVAMAQRTAFTNSPDGNWNAGSDAGSGNGSGQRINEKVGAAGVMLGPFGTEIGGSGSAGRHSAGDSMASGGNSVGLTPASILAPGSGPSPGESSGGYSGVLPGGPRYHGRLSEGDEETEAAGPSRWGRPDTAHSSMEDLLGGQEPSFFSVVLNPRRTLRVVNLD